MLQFLDHNKVYAFESRDLHKDNEDHLSKPMQNWQEARKYDRCGQSQHKLYHRLKINTI